MYIVPFILIHSPTCTNHNLFRSDINKATWEESEVPAVCENCLGSNPYVRMIREKFGAECKLCTRPFTMFRWLPEKGAKYKRTSICLTCARQRNCCQSCLMDLTYGLPIALRDAALKMVGDGTTSVHENSNAVIKQYIAQNFEGSEDASLDAARRRALEESEAAKRLLQSLATSMPYYKQQLRQAAASSPASRLVKEKESADGKSNQAIAVEVSKLASKLPLNGTAKPPSDQTIISLFIMGIEEDLPDYLIKEHFSQFGKVTSVVCVHRAKCAFVNFADRKSAENAALKGSNPEGSGKLVIKGCKLRLAWAKPRSLGTTNAEHTRLGQIIRKAMIQRNYKEKHRSGNPSGKRGSPDGNNSAVEVKQLPLPPGATKTVYKSQQSNFEL